MAAYADARAAANSVLPLATDAPLYDKIRRRTREDGVDEISDTKEALANDDCDVDSWDGMLPNFASNAREELSLIHI